MSRLEMLENQLEVYSKVRGYTYKTYRFCYSYGLTFSD